MKKARLYEFNCPYCGHFERLFLDSNVEEITCKKCNQKSSVDCAFSLETGNMEFHGDIPVAYVPNEEKESLRR